MKHEKLFEAMGHMDEAFLAESLDEKPSRKVFFSGRMLRNLLAAALAVALLGCVVLANTVPAEQKPAWEPYAGADTLLDILFGTRCYTAGEGGYRIQYVWVGNKEDGTHYQEEVQIPITSGASREPVSEELAALVEPYLIPVGKTITDPTGTMTLEVMAYFYEPETNFGLVYYKLTDPTGEFGGYVVRTPILNAGEEYGEEKPKGISTYLSMFERHWGQSFYSYCHSNIRLIEAQSDDTTWTFVSGFSIDENTDAVKIGFETGRGVDYRPYRVNIDLNRRPTMQTISLGNAGNREIVTLSPVSIRIHGSGIRQGWYDASSIVIHFEDGSSYTVKDEETGVNGYASGSGYQAEEDGYSAGYLLSNIIDIHQVKSVEIDGVQYVFINW